MIYIYDLYVYIQVIDELSHLEIDPENLGRRLSVSERRKVALLDEASAHHEQVISN